MNILIELLGLWGMAFLIASWTPKVRKNDNIFDLFTLICCTFFLIQAIILGILTNTLNQSILIILVGYSYYNRQKRNDKNA